MAKNSKISKFFFPSINRRFIIRISLIVILAYVLFGYIIIPLNIAGHSMEPTYHNGGINFCWRLKYFYTKPARQDVVVVRFAGKKVMLLKRIVAVEGETVEFRQGKLFINGNVIDEPYVRFPCDWNLSPRLVEKNRVYVVGDNRNVLIEKHDFGQVSIDRIMGVPLW
jgi:signal peptidase I